MIKIIEGKMRFLLISIFLVFTACSSMSNKNNEFVIFPKWPKHAMQENSHSQKNQKRNIATTGDNCHIYAIEREISYKSSSRRIFTSAIKMGKPSDPSATYDFYVKDGAVIAENPFRKLKEEFISSSSSYLDDNGDINERMNQKMIAIIERLGLMGSIRISIEAYMSDEINGPISNIWISILDFGKDYDMAVIASGHLPLHLEDGPRNLSVSCE